MEYIVQAGDTLSQIARKQAIPLYAIVRANEIDDPNQIRVGQRLKLPVMTSDQATPAAYPIAFAYEADIAIDRTMRLATGQYFAQPQKKDLVMLHFTAGLSAAGAFASWTSTAVEIGTAYILDLNGTVYEVFPPDCWAYHLGVAASESQGWLHDKRSVGIEIVNPGGLQRRGDTLYWWPPANTFQTPYCTLAETHKYVRSSYRGVDYFATFSAAQLAVLPKLVTHIRRMMGIVDAVPERRKCNVIDWSYYRTFQGIASHQNFNPQKSDIGPAFDWALLGG